MVSAFGLRDANRRTGAKAMKFLTFSFKNEAIWMIVFEFGPIVLAVFIFLIIYLLRSLL